MQEAVQTLEPEAPPAKIPIGKAPGSAIGRLKNVQGLKESKDRKQQKFLKLFKKETERAMELENHPYPDILKLLKSLKIPYQTYFVWKDDPAFMAALDEMEDLQVEAAAEVVFNAKSKNPYLALDILRARFRKKWGQTPAINQSFTQINLISEVPRPQLHSNIREIAAIAEFPEKPENLISTFIPHSSNTNYQEQPIQEDEQGE